MIRIRRVLLFGLVVVGLVVGALVQISRQDTNLTQRPSRSTRQARERDRDKTAPNHDEYVGSQTCAACHPNEYASYLRTAHSRSFSQVDPKSEPSDVVFTHVASGRTYEVFRKGSEFIHRESVKTSEADPPIVSEFPVKYLVGSGRHTRSYLIDDQGFLAESPVTWYAARQTWDMSPGYDRPQHHGFERTTDLGCLFCHLGRVDPTEGNSARPKILELAIGCERCHGPGGKHVAARSRDRDGAVAADSRMVHPAKLSRDLAESICSDCHLRGDATVVRRGKGIKDFKPGLPLHDFRIDYHIRSESSGMKVVGHVEQMRLSRCYQSSETMTCTTCHDPHGSPSESEKITYYRNRCLSCHQESCKVDEPTRRQKTAEDSCVVCHMPQTDTEIRHLAFTHHRIGIHNDSNKSAPAPVVGQLVAMDLPANLSELDRDRNLGLAYHELSDHTSPGIAPGYRKLAFDLMRKAYHAGATDGELLAALARIYWEEDSAEAVGYAAEALRDRDISERAAANSLLILGETKLRGGDPVTAQNSLSRLVQLRRQVDDWMLLGSTHEKAGDENASLKSLQRAAVISPFRADVHHSLADAYRAVNDKESARQHDSLARQLSAAMKAKTLREAGKSTDSPSKGETAK